MHTIDKTYQYRKDTMLIKQYHLKPVSKDDTTGFAPLLLMRNNCKGYDLFGLKAAAKEVPVVLLKDTIQPFIVKNTATPIKHTAPLLTIKGNILYDVNYRSFTDTPYAEKEVYQHTVQTYLDLTWKNKYPFRAYFTTRFSNSALFRNYTDVNLQYNQQQFIQQIQKKIIQAAEKLFPIDTLNALQAKIGNEQLLLNQLQANLQRPDKLQRLVEEREAALLKQRNLTIIKKTDVTAITGYLAEKYDKNIFTKSRANRLVLSDKSDTIKTMEEKKIGFSDSMKIYTHKADSIRNKIHYLDSIYRSLKQMREKGIAGLKSDIEKTADLKKLTGKLEQMHVPHSALPKGYQTLLAVKSFSIGRSTVNYSELSAENLSITGIQAEYNPHYYYAVATGIVDYRFRDYIIASNASNNAKQYIALVRFGKGLPDESHLYFTYYTGQRQLYNALSIQGQTVPNYLLSGFTVEGVYKLNAVTYVIAEIAKSSSPYYSLDTAIHHSLVKNMVDFSDRTNEAYSLKVYTTIKKFNTRISSNIKYAGANFQSFSLFTSGASQFSFSLKAEQSFFKRRLLIIGSIKKNDFTNPFINSSYHSSSIMGGIQATLRIKKWPTVSLGYFPSSQIIKLSDNSFNESLFYTLTATLTHFYRVNKIQMFSTAVYTQFYNHQADTGFVYFNTKNYLLSHNVIFSKLSYQLNGSVATASGYSLYTLDNRLQLSVSQLISIGGGVKYNYQTVFENTQWGYSANGIVKIPRFGNIQLSADKGFIPGANRKLVDNSVGRLTYFKTF